LQQKSISGREAALLVLCRIEKDKAYPNIALKEELGKDTVSKPDKGFANELVMGVLRRKIYLDNVIDCYSSLKRKKIALPILCILRLSVYQLLFLKNIPPHAVINEAVILAKRYGHKASAGFVNGVLRSVVRNPERLVLPDQKDLVEYLHITESFPKFLIEKFLRDFGEDFTRALLPALNQPQKTQIRVNRMKTTRDQLHEMLAKQGIKMHPSPYNLAGGEISAGTAVEEIEHFRQGYFTVQGIASQLAVESLGVQKGDIILDLCAAPGGKSTYIGELLENTGQVIAVDIFDHKLELIRKNAARLGLGNIQPVRNDAAVKNPAFIGRFDKILCDVPCSGLGVLAKKPDIRYNIKTSDFDTLILLQRSILDNAAAYLKPGGILVYSTCTINPDENLRQIERFLQEHSAFSLCNLSSVLLMLSDPGLSKGYLTLVPHMHGTDGFFIAKLQKND
jgi:16S rRNA (cytosine967-C5)-methyltransferase